MKSLQFKSYLKVGCLIIILQFVVSGCGFYKLNDVNPLPPDVKTVRVQSFTFSNSAAAVYQDPQLPPAVTERLRQKIVSQTKLTDTKSETAHWDISGKITDFSVSTSGVTTSSGTQQASINRLTVSAHITVNKTVPASEVQEFDVSRSFDFDARLSLQTAEATLLDQIVKNLTDEIFNHIFSNWD